MVEPRCEFGLCALDNYLYAFGGWVGEDIGGTIEIYDPVQDTWTLDGELPDARFSMGVVAYEGTNADLSRLRSMIYLNLLRSTKRHL